MAPLFLTVEASQYIVVCTASLNKAVKNCNPLLLKIGGYQVHFFPDEFYKPADYIITLNLDLINTTIKDEHKSICRSLGTVPVSHFDYFSLTQICGNTCAQGPEPMGQWPVMIQVPIGILIEQRNNNLVHYGNYS